MFGDDICLGWRLSFNAWFVLMLYVKSLFKYLQNSFFYRTTPAWNGLPSGIVKAGNIDLFKACLAIYAMHASAHVDDTLTSILTNTTNKLNFYSLSIVLYIYTNVSSFLLFNH